MPANALDDDDWDTIVSRISNGRCTPFLGAGMSAHRLPTGRALAQALAEKHGYPFDDRDNLPRVAQYAAVIRNDIPRIKEQVARQFSVATDKITAADFADRADPHRILADLPFAKYLTTNYDPFIERALEAAGTPHVVDLCAWNPATRKHVAGERVRGGGGASPTTDSDSVPLVYHLHGVQEFPESMVLTEDDYLDFLAEIAMDPRCIRPDVSEVFAESSVLFLGYSLSDITFRVIFRIALQQLQLNRQRAHVAVQLPPTGNSEEIAQAIQQYLEHYLKLTMNVRFFWGTAVDFTRELRTRWVKVHGDAGRTVATP
ncbi:MAG: SIR2 family protein [Gemmatimonadetes bacterium]|nr:SIR2 family protein [Gemmatimonadota bacterium]